MPPKSPASLYGGLEIVLRHLAHYRRQAIAVSLFGALLSIANSFVPFLTGLFFDAIISPTKISFPQTDLEAPLWAILIAVWLLVQAVADVSEWYKDKIGMKICTDIFSNYHAESIARLLALPVSFHKTQKTGEVWDKIHRAGNYLWQITVNVILNLAPQFLSVAIGLAIAFYLSAPLGTILVFGLAVYIALLAKVVPPIAEMQRKSHEAWSKAFGDTYDAVANYNTVKQSTAEDYEGRRATLLFVKRASQIWFDIEKRWNSLRFSQRLAITFTRLAVFLVSLHLILAGRLTLGELIALNGYSMMVFGPFVQLGLNWQAIQNGMISLQNTERLLSSPAEKYEPKNPVVLDSIAGNVEFRDVSFGYKKSGLRVLESVSFSVVAGEKVALVGESGGGKSTLVNLISNYYFAQKGKVLIDGHDVRRLNLKFLRGNIAVVPQEVTLFNDTIKNNIRYGSFGADDAMVEAAAREAHADDFINRFPNKYNQKVGERGVKLSVGQKQRIAIARAILRNPKILVLDEPTSALDIKTERLITESLERLMQGRTTFIIAHRLSTVRAADRILVFEKGRLVEQGSHGELIKIPGGVYRRLYDMHVGLK